MALNRQFLDALRAGDIEQVKAALNAGADVQAAAGQCFNTLIADKKIDLVQELVSRGIELNWQGYQQDIAHCLVVAASLDESDLRKKFFDLLIEGGADPRAGKCRPLGVLSTAGKTEAFALHDKVDPGSEIMMFYLLSHPAIRGEALKRQPFLQSWIDRDMLTPLVSGFGWQKWMDGLTADDLRKNDGFVQKMAVFSSRSDLYLPHVIKMGADFNTQKDPPLKIAVLLGKTSLIDTLTEKGADIYADRASPVRLARALGSQEMRDEMQGQIKKAEKKSGDIFAAAFSTGINADKLREPLSAAEETGWMTAAKAGKLRDHKVAGVFLRLTPDDFSKTDRHGATLATILIARGEYDLLFTLKIWEADMAGAEKIWKTLSREEQKQAATHYLELQKHQATLKYQRNLNRLSQKNKIRINPRKKGL